MQTDENLLYVPSVDMGNNTEPCRRYAVSAQCQVPALPFQRCRGYRVAAVIESRLRHVHLSRRRRLSGTQQGVRRQTVVRYARARIRTYLAVCHSRSVFSARHCDTFTLVGIASGIQKGQTQAETLLLLAVLRKMGKFSGRQSVQERTAILNMCRSEWNGEFFLKKMQALRKKNRIFANPKKQK